MRRALVLTALVLASQLCACAKQNHSPPPSSAESKGLFNASCSSNLDCQGLMCRGGRCH